ncbi:hypothetical protein [Undibacterium umbellatum]|uniref:Uncharacterized protein n=1 Tax=Undibacterium umbellatum TaxID=2762300 RepID=A0ABR6Z8N3_9BURK|nr:hypothetical protein [Undibacterium umbellatum]MBC3908033.1 hypothetical protein [Undibacterium umbellatum]
MNEKNHVAQTQNLNWISHPLVGQYRHRAEHNDWIAEAKVHGIDYPVSINAMGSEPIQAQMDIFAELIARLPEIIASSNLPDAPTEEWRKKHPDYRLLNAPISCLYLHEDGSFYVRLDAYPEDDWLPGFDISPDFKVILAEWGV